MSERYATPEMLQALAAPTPKSEVKTKPGRGGSGALSYIDARFVFDRFDSALGPDLWSVEIITLDNIHTPERKTRQDKVLESEWLSSYPSAKIGVLTENGWVYKQDVGTFSDIEGVKGSVSDSIKRAAVQWGVGRDLYDEDSEVRSTKPKSQEAEKLRQQSDEVEAAVVGQTGLTQSQRGLLFARLKEAGVTGDQRKAFAWLALQKHSVKDMTSEDLDKAIAILDAPRSENPEVWENIELVSGE